MTVFRGTPGASPGRNYRRSIPVASCLILCAAIAGSVSLPAATAGKIAAKSFYARAKKAVEPIVIFTPVTKVTIDMPDDPETPEILAEPEGTDDFPPDAGPGDSPLHRGESKKREKHLPLSLASGQKFSVRAFVEEPVTIDQSYDPDGLKVRLVLRQMGSQHGSNPNAPHPDGDDTQDTLLFKITKKLSVGPDNTAWTFYATENGKADGTPLKAGKYVLKIRRVLVAPSETFPTVVKVRFRVP